MLITEEFDLTTTQEEVVVSATIAGAIIGAVVGGRCVVSGWMRVEICTFVMCSLTITGGGWWSPSLPPSRPVTHTYTDMHTDLHTSTHIHTRAHVFRLSSTHGRKPVILLAAVVFILGVFLSLELSLNSLPLSLTLSHSNSISLSLSLSLS